MSLTYSATLRESFLSRESSKSSALISAWVKLETSKIGLAITTDPCSCLGSCFTSSLGLGCRMLGRTLSVGLTEVKVVAVDETLGFAAVVANWLVAMFVMRRNTPGLVAAGFSLVVRPTFCSTAGFTFLLTTLSLGICRIYEFKVIFFL
jgi:hypothetical protein